MPDNQQFTTVKEFLDTAIFPTDLLQRPEANPDLPGGIARIDLTAWQADMIAQAMEVALKSAEENDRNVVFADDPDGGHMSLQTLIAGRFLNYFSTLAGVLEALEEHVDAEQLAG